MEKEEIGEDLMFMEMDEGALLMEKAEKGEGSTVVFSRESSLLSRDTRGQRSSYCGGIAKLHSPASAIDGAAEAHRKEKNWKLRRLERIEFGRLFQGAVSSRDWELAESLISVADLLALNDALCISLDSIWFLTTKPELEGITWLIGKVVHSGACDFTRAALRTSFLASCVSACQSKTMSLADTVTIMAGRLHERLQECNGEELLKVEAGAKVQKFTEWALKCIGIHSRCHGNRNRGGSQTNIAEIQLQLSAFKKFLDLAGGNLSGKDFTEAFDAACFPLTLFSSSFEPGWASGTSAAAIHGLLGLLVEGGADNVNQCFLEASRFGSTELVRILLQIAQRNSLDVDVDLALAFAAHYSKISTMECLVEEGNAIAFLGPLMRASERGCIQVVAWFVRRGCRDMEICLALTAAASRCQIDIASYLLPHVPPHVLSALSVEILKAAGERSRGSLDGVSFLLHSDFLGDPAATYAVADSIARSDEEAVAPDLKQFLHKNWSRDAFVEGMRSGEEHYLNIVRVLRRGRSPLSLIDLPTPLVAAIAYLPLYRECVAACRKLLPQLLRGQLVQAARRVGGGGRSFQDDEAFRFDDLLAVLEQHLPPFLIHENPPKGVSNVSYKSVSP